MDNITIVTWPPGRRSLMAQMLDICLGRNWTAMLEVGSALNASADGGVVKEIAHQVLPQTEDRYYLIEYEDFPLSTTMRYEGYVAKGGEDTPKAFCRFASEEFSRYQAFAQRWIASDFAQNQLLVDAVELRANTKAWLLWALSIVAPGISVSDEAVTDALALASTWAAKPPAIESFRHYDAAVFAQLAKLRLKRALALQIAREAQILQDDDTILRLQTYETPEQAKLSLTTAPAAMSSAASATVSHGASLSRDQIGLAYELLLNRKASTAEVDSVVLRGHSAQSLGNTFLNSVEFSKKYAVRKAALKQTNPPVVIHLHIPKSAGTSLTAILAPNFPPGKKLALDPPYIPQLMTKPVTDRMQLRFVFGHLEHGVGEIFPQGCVYVSALRKPGPRALSYFRYLQRRTDHPHHPDVTKNNMTFGDFLEFCASNIGQRLEMDNGQIRRLAGMMQPNSIGDELAVFRRAMTNAFAPNMVFGLTEHFEKLLQDLVERKLISTYQTVVQNAAPEKAHFEEAYDGLQPHQRQLLNKFTYWDEKFYDICEIYLLGTKTSQDIRP